MLTVAELIAAMEGSGRRLTRRTARNWWTIGILPRPQRTGLGRGIGTVSFWCDHRVLLQAQIAHDLLGTRVSLQGAAAALWLVGFSVPIKIVRGAFTRQIAGHYRRGRGRSRDGLEAGLWQHVDRLVKLDARIRMGSIGDEEGTALYAWTGQWLELLCGVGDESPKQEDSLQWAIDTAGDLHSQIETLGRLGRLNGVKSNPAEETIKEAVTWIRETASLRHQRDAVIKAMPHDWTRARRITRVAIGILDRGNAAASPELHVANRAFFTRSAVAWARLLFPVLLAIVRNPEQRRTATTFIFKVAASVRAGPVSQRNAKSQKLGDRRTGPKAIGVGTLPPAESRRRSASYRRSG